MSADLDVIDSTCTGNRLHPSPYDVPELLIATLFRILSANGSFKESVPAKSASLRSLFGQDRQLVPTAQARFDAGLARSILINAVVSGNG
jgi:hypothetical protein